MLGGPDYPVHFNHQTGINIGTKEAGDQKVIAEKLRDCSFIVLHKISSEQLYVFASIGQTTKAVTLTIYSIKKIQTPLGRANKAALHSACSWSPGTHAKSQQ